MKSRSMANGEGRIAVSSYIIVFHLAWWEALLWCIGDGVLNDSCKIFFSQKERGSSAATRNHLEAIWSAGPVRSVVHT